MIFWEALKTIGVIIVLILSGMAILVCAIGLLITTIALLGKVFGLIVGLALIILAVTLGSFLFERFC